MSALVDDAIRAAGLWPLLAERRRGSAVSPAHARALRDADWLVLGALAERVCLEEMGPEVRIYVDIRPPSEPPSVEFPADAGDVTGLELLREIAMARLVGPRAARVGVDWVRCGLELAQVAIGFGANELAGRIATKGGLLIADDELAGVGKKSRRELARTLKRRELADAVRRAGRIPVFMDRDDGAKDAAGEGEREVAPELPHGAPSPEAR